MPVQTRARTSVGTRALIGLAAGLAVGAGVSSASLAILREIGSAVEVVGTLWINAILMTILPLVVSKIVVSIGGTGDVRAVGRSGWRAGLLFVGLLTAAAMFSVAIMPAVFARLSVDPAARAALGTAALNSSTAAAPPTAAQWVLALVPTNPVKSAADGGIVPLLVFSVAFALGASRISPSLRDPLVTVFRAIDAAITVLLHWIVAFSPYGVFALGLGLAMRVGVGIVAALGYYILVSSGALIVFTALLYIVVWIGGGISPRRFARAAAPAQIVAFGTHSSMASLPAMVEGVEMELGVSPTGTGFVLPLALAVFKYSGPVWFVVVTCFISRLYGVAIDPSRAVAVIVASVVTSVAIGGVPSGAVVVVAPVLSAAGLPLEAMGMLLAVDPIPNAFRTVANVTGMMAVTILADDRKRPIQAAPETVNMR